MISGLIPQWLVAFPWAAVAGWAVVGFGVSKLYRAWRRSGLSVGAYLSWLSWLWNQGYFWFQRKRPHKEFSTRVYEGLPGSGKTLFMVRDCIELMRRGVVVYSNVAIRDPLTGNETLPLGGWLDMLRASVDALAEVYYCELKGTRPRGVVFAFDEIHLAADARSWQSTPAWWLNLMAQRRHYGVGLIGTTQHADTVEKRLRMLIGRVVRVRPSGVRGLFDSVPLFVAQDVDMALVDVPGQDALGKPALTWIRADAFHGYSTQELMATLDFKELSDDESRAEVAELTRRARELAAPVFIEAFVDPVLEEYEGIDRGMLVA